MQDHLSNSIKSLRASELSKIADETRKENFTSIKNRTFAVLFETPKGEYQCGYTKNYTPVKVLSNINICNEIRNVCITETYDDYCIGELV
jgi:threonylcarbamoyladenosine tRNA methylthiotransferase MtaB